MSVGENLFLGALPRRHGLIDWDQVYARAATVLAECGMRLDPATRVADLGVGQQQLVEIARAIARKPRVLVLDEPTAALAQHEVDTLLGLIRELRLHGTACIYISHKLDEVFAIADRITVLRDGAAQGTLDAHATSVDEVIRLMVGRRIEDFFPRRQPTPGKTLLAVRGLGVAATKESSPLLRDIGFEAKAGEVLGIGGLMGSGRTELLLHLIGLWGTRTSGTVELDGASLRRAWTTQGVARRARARLGRPQALRTRAPARHCLQRLAVLAGETAPRSVRRRRRARSYRRRPPSRTCTSRRRRSTSRSPRCRAATSRKSFSARY